MTKNIFPSVFGKSSVTISFFIILTLVLAAATISPGNSVSTSFTYQGKLYYFSNPANGTYDFEFKLFNAESSGSQVGSTVAKNDLTVSNGLFVVELDFGSAPYTGNGLWLEISVRGGAEVTPHIALTPRQKVNPSPYSQYSYNSGALEGHASDYFSAATHVHEDIFWKKGGNAGATQNSLGTTENSALDIIANNSRVVKYQPNATSPSILAGSAANTVATGVAGAALSGGGSAAHINKIRDNYGTIAGGEGNQAGDDGILIVDAIYATVGGGYGNIASGASSTVPGGKENTASGISSMASGYRAKALHNGSFVWSDASSDVAFQSTKENQFLIRAAGGVGIGLADPDSPLHVLGGNWDLGSTEGDLKIGNDTHRLKMGVALGGGGAGTSRIRSVGGQNSLILGSGANDVLTIKGTDVSNAGEYKYTAAKTFVKQIPVSAFQIAVYQLVSSNEISYMADGYIEYDALAPYTLLTAPVSLPDGAVVTEFKLYYYDNDNDDSFSSTVNPNFNLKRRGVLQKTAQKVAGINFTTEGLASSDSVRALSTTSISYATIDNANYQYFIYGEAYPYMNDENKLFFYGASITYTLTTLKP